MRGSENTITPETHIKKKTCDGNILLRLMRGSQNTIVSAAKAIAKLQPYKCLRIHKKIVLCGSFKILCVTVNIYFARTAWLSPTVRM